MLNNAYCLGVLTSDILLVRLSRAISRGEDTFSPPVHMVAPPMVIQSCPWAESTCRSGCVGLDWVGLTLSAFYGLGWVGSWVSVVRLQK